MTEQIIGRRIQDGLGAFEAPNYPSELLAARIAAAHPRAGARSRALRGAIAVVAAAIVAGASVAFAVPNALSDRMLRTLDNVGIHLRGRPILALESRQVSLAEVRALTDFPVVVPLGIRITRVLLSTDRRHHAFVSIVLQDGRGSQIQLEETHTASGVADEKPLPVYQIESNARSVAPSRGPWVAVGPAQPRPASATPGSVVVIAERMVVYHGHGLTFFAIKKIDPIRWTLGATTLLIAPADAKSRAFAERVRRATFTDGAARSGP